MAFSKPSEDTGSKDSGYDVQVIGGYPPELNCSICTLIIKDAMHGCKNHAFCNSCVTKYLTYGVRNESSMKCPGGCGEIISSTNLQPNHFADRMIKTLRTKCSNVFCSWQGDLLDLVQIHQVNCEYDQITCDNKGCYEKFFKRDVMKHSKVCLYETVQCSYCYNDILKINQEKHEAACLSGKIKCGYFDIGCDVIFSRQDMHSHEINYEAQHMRLLYVYFNSQFSGCTKELTKCKNELPKYKNELTKCKSELEKCKNELTRCKNELPKCKNELTKCKNELDKCKNEFTKCTSELSVCKEDILKSKQEVSAVKQQYVELTKQFKEFKIHSSEEIFALKEQTNKRHLLEDKDEKIIQEEKTEKHDNPAQSESTKLKANKSPMEINQSHLNQLKEKMSVTSALKDNFLLLTNDQLVFARCCWGFYISQLSKCYEKSRFNYMINLMSLNNHKILIEEILHEVSYHLYQYKRPECYYYCFVFPLELNNVKDVNSLKYKTISMKIQNNELLVEITSASKAFVYLYVGKYKIKVEIGVKFNLQHVDDSMLNEEGFIFANAYGCLQIRLKK